jgi:hypothetical protein
MFIYLLRFHGEDGPEDLKATLDRERLITIFKIRRRSFVGNNRWNT